MLNFLPHTPEQRQEMLAAIGLSTEADLFSDVPDEIKVKSPWQLVPQQGLSELELQQAITIAAKQNTAHSMYSFLGGGAYHRFIPPAVNTIASRSEFYTAYTPYQAEISQGTLQVVYEFQTMIAELTGLDVANASVYDGGCAVVEAVLMALRIQRKNTIVLSASVHPQTRQIVDTYLKFLGGVSLITVPEDTLTPSGLAAQGLSSQDVAAIVLQTPDYLGRLHDLQHVKQTCDSLKALFIVSADPVSLGLLEAPGNLGADIVVGDIQPLGNNLFYGGPYGGYMATREQYLRQLPGRLVGKTVDADQRPCYTLTLQTREQHIRRDKATSNICTNQALNVLKATVYMALVGPKGLCDIALLSAQKAHQLAQALTSLSGVSLRYPQHPFWTEFVLQIETIPVNVLLSRLQQYNIIGGISLSDSELLVTATELTTTDQVMAYQTALAQCLNTDGGI